MVRYLIIFKGRVQGVGFRWTVKEIAQRYQITGYARNLYNGNVEVQAQGQKSLFDGFFREVMEPRRFILIEDYVIKAIPVVENEKGFTALS